MKLPPFDHARKQWDRFGAFYVDLHNGMFSQFETGELRVNRTGTRQPIERQYYRNLGVRIVSANDMRHLPFSLLTPDGVAVPCSTLAGNQYFLWDEATSRLVSLNGRTGGEQPKHLRYANACFHSEGTPPISAANVCYRVPSKENTWKTWRKEARTIAIALYELSDKSIRWRTHKVDVAIAAMERTTPHAFVTGMGSSTIHNIAVAGFAPLREGRSVPYLLATPRFLTR